MLRFVVAAAAIALILEGTGVASVAQGVAPGDPIYNSTGIGSGLGGVIGGTGPQYPNGTTPPTLTPAPPPGGGVASSAAPPSISPSQPLPTPQPRPWSGRMPPPATEPLRLPGQPTEDLAFLKGCWRTDVFQYEQQAGLSTWCFDGKGVGRFLYTRVNQPNFFCHARAQAGYEGQVLKLHSLAASCSDGSSLSLEYLACNPAGDQTARCDGNPSPQSPAGGWIVRLYKVRYHPS